jgi:hypothetical protein
MTNITNFYEDCHLDLFLFFNCIKNGVWLGLHRGECSHEIMFIDDNNRRLFSVELFHSPRKEEH